MDNENLRKKLKELKEKDKKINEEKKLKSEIAKLEEKTKNRNLFEKRFKYIWDRI